MILNMISGNSSDEINKTMRHVLVDYPEGWTCTLSRAAYTESPGITLKADNTSGFWMFPLPISSSTMSQSSDTYTIRCLSPAYDSSNLSVLTYSFSVSRYTNKYCLKVILRPNQNLYTSDVTKWSIIDTNGIVTNPGTMKLETNTEYKTVNGVRIMPGEITFTSNTTSARKGIMLSEPISLRGHRYLHVGAQTTLTSGSDDDIVAISTTPNLSTSSRVAYGRLPYKGYEVYSSSSTIVGDYNKTPTPWWGVTFDLSSLNLEDDKRYYITLSIKAGTSHRLIVSKMWFSDSSSGTLPNAGYDNSGREEFLA